MTTRADVVSAARRYLGTPFLHMGRQPGLALDCAGTVICLMRDLGLVAPDFDVPPYRSTPDGSTMRAICEQYLTPVRDVMLPGNVMLLITDALPQHMGVLGDYQHGGLSIIHAANSVRPPRVIETRLLFSRVQRFVSAYAIPGVER